MRRRLRIVIALPVTAAVLAAGCATSSPPSSSEPTAEFPRASHAPVEPTDSAQLEEVLQQIDSARLIHAEGAGGNGDHRIGPDDLLDILVFDAPELSGEVRVSSQGEIALPLVGAVPARGSTPSELSVALEERLRERYMRDPHVTVQLRETRSRPVYVLGEIARPGSFDFDAHDRLTVLQALAMGGGAGDLAATDRAVLIRTGPTGERSQLVVDLDDAIRGKAPDTPMQAHDVLFVPRSSARSVIRGALGALSRIITLRAIF